MHYLAEERAQRRMPPRVLAIQTTLTHGDTNVQTNEFYGTISQNSEQKAETHERKT